MRTNILLDDDLLERGFALTGIKTKTELVTEALKEFVENRERLNLRDLRGSGGILEHYDYKTLRAGEIPDVSC